MALLAWLLHTGVTKGLPWLYRYYKQKQAQKLAEQDESDEEDGDEEQMKK